MTTMRTYCDGCAATHALDLIGERWALLVVRELLLGPKRFTDLRAGLPGVSPNVLAQLVVVLVNRPGLFKASVPF
jgi:DNA-binding HxlR family transcriptional regulator